MKKRNSDHGCSQLPYCTADCNMNGFRVVLTNFFTNSTLLVVATLTKKLKHLRDSLKDKMLKV